MNYITFSEINFIEETLEDILVFIDEAFATDEDLPYLFYDLKDQVNEALRILKGIKVYDDSPDNS